MDQLTQTLAANSLESGKTAGSPVQPGADVGRGEAAGSEKVEANENKDDSSSTADKWVPTPEWISSWKNKMPLQTVMRMLQVQRLFWPQTKSNWDLLAPNLVQLGLRRPLLLYFQHLIQ